MVTDSFTRRDDLEPALSTMCEWKQNWRFPSLLNPYNPLSLWPYGGNDAQSWRLVFALTAPSIFKKKKYGSLIRTNVMRNKNC